MLPAKIREKGKGWNGEKVEKWTVKKFESWAAAGLERWEAVEVLCRNRKALRAQDTSMQGHERTKGSCTDYSQEWGHWVI